MAKEKIIGAKALIEALANENVEVIFGYPGAATIPIHDVLMDGKIRHILVRHEQGAAHAADGYARATGKVGVCLATSGPGALNLVTGIANAYMDSVPMVAITGQVATIKLGTDAFQEADVTGVTMPIVKHNFLIKDVSEIADTVKRSFHIASTGRPGPVVIDIPLDVLFAEIEYENLDTIDIRSYHPTVIGHPRQIKRAAALINGAQKPLVCAGGGVIASGASSELKALMEIAEIPSVYTLMGKGVIPDSHRLNLGMLGMHGHARANYAAHDCDLLISIGMRFSDRSTGKTAAFAPNAKIIHIDIDPAEIGKMKKPTLPIVGDAKNILLALLNSVAAAKHDDWMKKISDWTKKHKTMPSCPNDGRIEPAEIFSALNSITGGNAIIATDVGQHQMWASQLCLVNAPRQFISSGGLGTMGFGLPAAIGAQAAFPDKDVFLIAGDGSILMNNQELMTAIEQKLPIKILLFNNGYLGMVRQWQQLFYNRRYASTDISAQPDFVMLVKSFGGEGFLVTESSKIKETIEKCMTIKDRPSLIDFHISREANVFPMIPTGGTVEDMLLQLD